MPRESHIARTRGGVEYGTERPTVQSELVQHAVAQERPVMDELSNAFGNFFTSLSNATATAEKAKQVTDHEIIQRENVEQGRKGQADALQGKPVDPTLATDYDYIDAHTKTVGVLHGTKLAEDWTAYASKLDVTANIDAEREKWLKDQVRNGSGDPLFDQSLLATFKQKSDVVNAAFHANQLKVFEQKAQSDFGTEIAAKTMNGDATGEDLQDWMSRAVPLMKGDVVKARAFVLSQMAGAARTPKALAQIDVALNKPGYDEKGNSFAQLFPAAAAQVSDEATDKYLKSTSSTGFLAFRSAGENLHQMEMSGDIEGIAQMVGPQGSLARINSQYGGEPQYQSLLAKAYSALTKVGGKLVSRNQYLAVARGESLLVDQQNINQNQMEVLAASNVDPLRSPEEATVAAAHVQSARGIADKLSATMGAALARKDNPQAQANAFTFWKALDATGFDVDSKMPKEVRSTYAALEYASRGSSLSAAITRLNENPSLAQLPAKAEEFDWSEMLGKVGTPKAQVYSEALQGIRKDVAKALDVQGRFFTAPEKLAMDDSVRNDIMSIYGRTMIEMRAAGNGNAADAAKEATLRAVQADYMTVPAANGAVRLMRKDSLPTQVPVAQVDYSDGKVTTSMRDAIGPGKYKNNGIEEDTVMTFKQDMKRLGQSAPFIFKDPSAFYAGYDSRITAQTGRFVLYNGDTNEPVMFEPGQKVSIPGVNLKGEAQDAIIALPNDPKVAREFIASRLPKEFTVEPTPVGNGLMVTYAYRLTGQPNMSELGAAWDAKRAGNIRATLEPEAQDAYDARSAWMETVKKSTDGAMQRQGSEPEMPLPKDPYWRAHEVARRQRNKFFANFGVKE